MQSYMHTRKRLIKYIKELNLGIGDRLPTEMQLTSELGIGRLKLREALNSLKNDGIIYSVQGSGTFLAADIDYISNTLNYNLSVCEMIERSGFCAGTVDQQRRIERADAKTAKNLGIAEGSDILVYSCIRTANDMPVAYSVDSIAPERAGQFLQIGDDGSSLYRFIEDVCKIQIGSVTADVEPVVCDEKLSELLGYEVGKPLMVIRQLVCSVQGAPLMYAQEYLRPDHFKFTLNRKREN